MEYRIGDIWQIKEIIEDMIKAGFIDSGWRKRLNEYRSKMKLAGVCPDVDEYGIYNEDGMQCINGEVIIPDIAVGIVNNAFARMKEAKGGCKVRKISGGGGLRCMVGGGSLVLDSSDIGAEEIEPHSRIFLSMVINTLKRREETDKPLTVTVLDSLIDRDTARMLCTRCEYFINYDWLTLNINKQLLVDTWLSSLKDKISANKITNTDEIQYCEIRGIAEKSSLTDRRQKQLRMQAVEILRSKGISAEESDSHTYRGRSYSAVFENDVITEAVIQSMPCIGDRSSADNGDSSAYRMEKLIGSPAAEQTAEMLTELSSLNLFKIETAGLIKIAANVKLKAGCSTKRCISDAVVCEGMGKLFIAVVQCSMLERCMKSDIVYDESSMGKLLTHKSGMAYCYCIDYFTNMLSKRAETGTNNV